MSPQAATMPPPAGAGMIMSDRSEPQPQIKPLPPRSSGAAAASGRGIDLRTAFSILSSRADAGGEADLAADHQRTVPAGVAERMRGMGQSIDLGGARGGDGDDPLAWTRVGEGCGCLPSPSEGTAGPANAANPNADADLEEQRSALAEQRDANTVKLREALSAMKATELIRAVLRAQEERVAAYRAYDHGLDDLLATGNLTAYPTVVAAATASFSVLSDTINAVREVLVEGGSDGTRREDLSKIIGELQRLEKDKLGKTAALHLERIREKNEAVSVGMEDGGDRRVLRMLQRGVAALRAEVRDIVEAINEVLEELRYAAADAEAV